MADRRSADGARAGDPEEKEVSRVFRAPRSLVFEVWTKADHFSRWFGPHGAEVFDCAIDARPGGAIRFGHRFADGTAFRFEGTFIEVLPDERLVFTMRTVDEHGQPVRLPSLAELPLDVSIETVVRLDDVSAGTRVRIAHRLLPADAGAHPAGMEWSRLAGEGSTQVLDRLGTHLSSVGARTEPTP